MHAPRPLVRLASRPLYLFGLHHRMPARWGRRILDLGALAPRRLPRGTVVRHISLGGRPCERTTVGATERPRAVLYLHGGGYSVGSPRLFRAAAAHLAQSSGAVVYNLDYRLAPEQPCPGAWEDATAAFRELVEVHGFAPSDIAIAGDSAGGGLSVATARTLTDEGKRPGALALFSPWTDPSNENHDLRRDFVTNHAWGKASAALYRADADPKDPRYAPMHGSLVGLPPMLVHYADSEMLRPEILRFAALAESAGVDVELVQLRGLWHSVIVLSGTLAAATRATQHAGAWLRGHLDTSLRDTRERATA